MRDLECFFVLVMAGELNLWHSVTLVDPVLVEWFNSSVRLKKKRMWHLRVCSIYSFSHENKHLPVGNKAELILQFTKYLSYISNWPYLA